MTKGMGLGCDGGALVEGPQLELNASALLKGLASRFSDADYVEATARALSSEGEDERAERVYRHARKLRPESGPLTREHASVLLRLGRQDEAIEALEAAISHQTLDEAERGLLECHLAECLRENGEYQRARELVEPWLLREETWDLATFIWVDCVTLSSRSLDQELKLAVEAGRASPAMIHAFLKELAFDANFDVARVILDAADRTLFPGWLLTIPDLNQLANKIVDATGPFRIAR